MKEWIHVEKYLPGNCRQVIVRLEDRNCEYLSAWYTTAWFNEEKHQWRIFNTVDEKDIEMYEVAYWCEFPDDFLFEHYKFGVDDVGVE